MVESNLLALQIPLLLFKAIKSSIVSFIHIHYFRCFIWLLPPIIYINFYNTSLPFIIISTPVVVVEILPPHRSTSCRCRRRPPLWMLDSNFGSLHLFVHLRCQTHSCAAEKNQFRLGLSSMKLAHQCSSLRITVLRRSHGPPNPNHSTQQWFSYSHSRDWHFIVVVIFRSLLFWSTCYLDWLMARTLVGVHLELWPYHPQVSVFFPLWPAPLTPRRTAQCQSVDPIPFDIKLSHFLVLDFWRR